MKLILLRQNFYTLFLMQLKVDLTPFFKISDELSHRVCLLVNIYVPIVIPYYLSAIAPVIDMDAEYPPSILRSFFCRVGLISCKDIQVYNGEQQVVLAKELWTKYENQLLKSDYCGEKKFSNTEVWKNRMSLFHALLELLTINNLNPGFNLGD